MAWVKLFIVLSIFLSPIVWAAPQLEMGREPAAKKAEGAKSKTAGKDKKKERKKSLKKEKKSVKAKKNPLKKKAQIKEKKKPKKTPSSPTEDSIGHQFEKKEPEGDELPPPNPVQPE